MSICTNLCSIRICSSCSVSVVVYGAVYVVLEYLVGQFVVAAAVTFVLVVFVVGPHGAVILAAIFFVAVKVVIVVEIGYYQM